MEKFRVHTGLVAPLDRANVDTDQIIPKQFLKRIERSGFGEFLFYDWRHLPDGTQDESFVLNDSRHKMASILLAGRNFGCGSSREHAPWALADWGFRAIIAPSFADIFANNCAKNGMLTVAMDERQVRLLMERASSTKGYELTIDLEQQLIKDSADFVCYFPFDAFQRQCLLNGLDDVALTLQHETAISDYEQSRPQWMSLQDSTI